MTKTIKVDGMTCNHCKMNVENGIKGVDGVAEVNADINSGDVIIEGEDYDLNEVKKAVNGLGYKYVG